MTNAKPEDSACTVECQPGSKTHELSCKLTTAEFRERKTTLLAGLKAQVLEKKELLNGYAFKFPGTDKMLDELTGFIKSERQCCDFFTFNLTVSGTKPEIWLELTGPEGAKEFVSSELGL